jgi:hypothetical protein
MQENKHVGGHPDCNAIVARQGPSVKSKAGEKLRGRMTTGIGGSVAGE